MLTNTPGVGSTKQRLLPAHQPCCWAQHDAGDAGEYTLQCCDWASKGPQGPGSTLGFFQWQSMRVFPFPLAHLVCKLLAHTHPPSGAKRHVGVWRGGLQGCALLQWSTTHQHTPHTSPQPSHHTPMCCSSPGWHWKLGCLGASACFLLLDLHPFSE